MVRVKAWVLAWCFLGVVGGGRGGSRGDWSVPNYFHTMEWKYLAEGQLRGVNV